MGTSRSGYFTERRDPRDIAQSQRDAEAAARDEAYDAAVNHELAELLKDFNSRDVAGTRNILEDIKNALADDIGGMVDLIFGGSVSRHTYVDGLSDTDALVILNPDDVGRTSPDRLKERFAQRLRELFGAHNVKVGDLAVTVTVRENEIQLLPAMRAGDGFRIASPDGRAWSKINPKGFAEKLTQANRAQDGKLVPTIKLVKALIASLPRKQQLSGYHIESLAIETFKNYDGPRTYKAMLTHFLNRAIELVKAPMRDRTGQSLYVDEYLGAQGSVDRRVASQALQRLHRKLINADASKSAQTWSELISGE